jgi:hypothetical protein
MAAQSIQQGYSEFRRGIKQMDNGFWQLVMEGDLSESVYSSIMDPLRKFDDKLYKKLSRIKGVR